MQSGKHDIRVSLHFHVYSILPHLQYEKGEESKSFVPHGMSEGEVSAAPQTESGALSCSRDLLTDWLLAVIPS